MPDSEGLQTQRSKEPGGTGEIDRSPSGRVVNHAQGDPDGTIHVVPGRVGDSNAIEQQGEILWKCAPYYVIQDLIRGQRDRSVRGRPGRIDSGGELRVEGSLQSGRRPISDLARVPVGIEVLEDDDRHILAHPFNLLSIPEREGVIVPIREEAPYGSTLMSRSYAQSTVA